MDVDKLAGAERVKPSKLLGALTLLKFKLVLSTDYLHANLLPSSWATKLWFVSTNKIV